MNIKSRIKNTDCYQYSTDAINQINKDLQKNPDKSVNDCISDLESSSESSSESSNSDEKKEPG